MIFVREKIDFLKKILNKHGHYAWMKIRTESQSIAYVPKKKKKVVVPNLILNKIKVTWLTQL